MRPLPIHSTIPKKPVHNRCGNGLDWVNDTACYRCGAGQQREIRTPLDYQFGGSLLAEVGMPVDPLCYTTERVHVGPWGSTTVEVKVPEQLQGDILLNRLGNDEVSSYLVQRGVRLAEGIFSPKAGRITVLLFNPTGKSIQIPPATPVGRFCLNPEVDGPPADMSIDEIVDALVIEGVNEEALEERRTQVKALLSVGGRTRYFSKTRTGRCLIGELDVEYPSVWDGT